MYGRYIPSRALFHYEDWKIYGYQYIDYTNSNSSWDHLYYTRRDFKNIPSDENIYNLFHYWYGDGTNTLWELIRLYSIYRL